jgi:hypothetical protein
LPKININIHIIKSRQEFDKLYGKKTENWLVGFADKDKINILDKNKFETDSIHSKSHFASTLKHEISHIYFKKLNPSGHPNWLDEGTAYVVAGQKEKEPKEVTVEKLKTYSRGSDRKIYSVGYFMVKKIIKEYGKDTLFELIKINDEDKVLSEVKRMFSWLK